MSQNGPGLFPAETVRSDMEQAVEKTISSKQDAGLLTDEHAAIVQLIRELAKAVAAGAATAKTSMPQAAQQLREALSELPVRVEDTEGEASLAAIMRGEAPVQLP